MHIYQNVKCSSSHGIPSSLAHCLEANSLKRSHLSIKSKEQSEQNQKDVNSTQTSISRKAAKVWISVWQVTFRMECNRLLWTQEAIISYDIQVLLSFYDPELFADLITYYTIMGKKGTNLFKTPCKYDFNENSCNTSWNCRFHDT